MNKIYQKEDTKNSNLPTTVIGDGLRLQQVAFNIMMNAIQYSQMDGNVFIDIYFDKNRS